MRMLSVLVACIVVNSSSSLSYSSPLLGGRRNPTGAVSMVTSMAKLQSCGAMHGRCQIKNRNAPHGDTPPSSSISSLHMALGGNYLDNIDNEKDEDGNNDGNNNRWGGFFGGGNNNNRATRGNNRDGGSNSGSRGRGGTGTAIRPSPPTNGSPNNANASRNTSPNPNNNNQYGIGSNNRGQNNMQPGLPRVFRIRQPQDLLDFVIQDERLSVVKVYASWCKTCQVFDVRYRKLASQLGDNFDGDELLSRGNVRFAEMQFDDPNNEEMCRLLNATKLPYILMYKGSKGKVADFQCGPAKFQLLIDAVNEYADPDGGSIMDAPAAMGVGGEQEWRVMREQQQKRNQELRQEQRASQYGGAGSISSYPPSSSDVQKLKQKEEEISRLYAELSNLRKDFDKRIVQLKEEHKKESNMLNERIRAQTKEYEDERRALTAQIKDLSREMMEREKSFRSSENSESSRLREEMKRKEEDYKQTLTGLNLRITELEQDLFKSRNELRYNSNANSNDQQRLSEHITQLESEINNLASKNEQLQKELIEEKRVVVASTEEASRVLKQLERIKSSEDEERKVLRARIVELEADIEQREKQMMDASGELAAEIQRELEELKKERDQERELMTSRIAELEQELLWQTQNNNNNNANSNEQQRQMENLRQESQRLTSKIHSLQKEIDERDRLLRTSNKATDILLDNMETQKREYERELDRATSLVEELEEAIANREEEMGMLQERFESLESMAEGLKRREEERRKAQEEEEAAKAAAEAEQQAANRYQFADAVRISQQQEQQQQQQAMAGSSLEMEREARIAAEQEVGKLMGFLKDREEEITRMQQQQQQQQQPSTPFSFGALFGGGGNANAEQQPINNWGWEGWEGASNEESMENYEMLKDVLMPDEISPQMMGEDPSMPRPGVGRSENIWEGAAGLSSFMNPNAGNENSGMGRYDNIREGAGMMAGGNVPSPSIPGPIGGGQLPTPAQAFERRLAENPIVPAGAFGGSKPTASFFRQSSGGGGGASAAPSDTPEYYQNAMNNFYGNENVNAPAMPPAQSYEQRPTMPAPRGAARPGMTENIYAGAGTASSAVPTPVPREEPVAQLPTPAMAFERRLAENPIVPSGAFGGSQPTAHFFSPKPSPPSAPGGAESSRTADVGNYYTSPRSSTSSASSSSSSSSSSSFPGKQEDPQTKWARLDDNEKKRVAAEAYKSFEKSLEDSRRNTQLKPKGGTTSMGTREAAVGRPPVATGGGGGGSDRANKRPTTAEGKNQSQMELERKKHQEMVKAAAAAAKATEEEASGGTSSPKASAPKIDSAPAQQQQQNQQQGQQQQKQQSMRQIQASAVQASAKRMSLAERAAKADQDRRDRERQMKAEARKAHESKRAESLKRVQDAKRREEDAKREDELKRAEELKRKAEADLKAATEAKAKANAEKAARQAAKDAEAAAAAQSAKVDPDMGGSGSKEMIEAALLGAMNEAAEMNSKGEPSTPNKGQENLLQQDKGEAPSSKQQTNNQEGQTTSQKAKRKVAGGFALSKYDVVVMKDPKNDVDMPQLMLEGSLKDLLKDGPPPKRRNRRNSNY